MMFESIKKQDQNNSFAGIRRALWPRGVEANRTGSGLLPHLPAEPWFGGPLPARPWRLLEALLVSSALNFQDVKGVSAAIKEHTKAVVMVVGIR